MHLGSLEQAELDSPLFDLEVDDGTDGGMTFAVRSARFSSAHALLEKRFGRRTISELAPSTASIHGSPMSVTSTIFKANPVDTVASPISEAHSLETLESPVIPSQVEDRQLSEILEAESAPVGDVEDLIAGVVPIVEHGISIERWEGASAETASEELVVVSLRSDSSSLPEQVTFPSFVGANAEANEDSGLSFVPLQRSQSVPVSQIAMDVTMSSITGSKTKSKWRLRSSLHKRKQVPSNPENELGADTAFGQNSLRKTMNGVIELLSTKPTIPKWKWMQMKPRAQMSADEEVVDGISAVPMEDVELD